MERNPTPDPAPFPFAIPQSAGQSNSAPTKPSSVATTKKQLQACNAVIKSEMLTMAFASGRRNPSGSASSIVANKSVGVPRPQDRRLLAHCRRTYRTAHQVPPLHRQWTSRIWFSLYGGHFEYVGLYLVLDDDIVAKSVTAQV
jgi:hypothetical protein